MARSNINTCFRLLSVFLAVVIVSVCFMQPIAYSSAIAAGGAIVLLVAALLVSVGLTFSSQQQLEAAANYALSAMPNDLRQELDNVIEVQFPDHSGGGGGSDPQWPKLPNTTASIIAGIAGTVLIGRNLYQRFKAWALEIFGVNESVESGDYTFEISSGDIIAGYYLCNFGNGDVSIPVWNMTRFINKNAERKEFISNKSIWRTWNGSINIAGNNYTLVSEYYKDYYDSSIGETLQKYKYTIYRNGVLMGNEYGETAYLSNFILTWTSGGYVRLAFPHYIREAKQGWSLVEFLSLPTNLIQSTPYINGGIDIPAYEYEIGEQAEVPIAITAEIADLVNKGYQDIINEYSLENWDYGKTLEEMQAQLIELSGKLDGVINNQAFQDEVNALQNEIGRLSELVGSQSVEYVGGIEALNNALVDAAYVIIDLKNAAKQSESDFQSQIEELEAALGKAKQDISDLINNSKPPQNPDPPTIVPDPPIVDPDPPEIELEDGEIEWSILLNVKIFDKFPFSLPKDVYSFFQAIAAPPKEPVFVFDIFAGKFGDAGKITLDFKMFDEIRILFRYCTLVSLIVGLIAATKTYIWSGGG